MTLFGRGAPAGPVFQQCLCRLFEGEGDPRTLALL
jgi:uncharacterized protein (DUF1810 family)